MEGDNGGLGNDAYGGVWEPGSTGCRREQNKAKHVPYPLPIVTHGRKPCPRSVPALFLLTTTMFAPVFAILLAALPVLGQDIVYTPVHNATVIYGTWASGSMGVVTGAVRPTYHERMI